MSWWSKAKHVIRCAWLGAGGCPEPIEVTRAKIEQEEREPTVFVFSKPGQIIPCDDPRKVQKVQTGYEWFEWWHGGKGVPWRVNTEEFNKMLMDGWKIIYIGGGLTVLNRPTFVHYLDTPRRKKK